MQWKSTLFVLLASSLAFGGIEKWETSIRVDVFKPLKELSLDTEWPPLNESPTFVLAASPATEQIYGWRDEKPEQVWNDTRTFQLPEKGEELTILLEKVQYPSGGIEYRARLTDEKGEIFVLEAQTAKALHENQARRVRYLAPSGKTYTLDIRFDQSL